jgi:hypothetical protein
MSKTLSVPTRRMWLCVLALCAVDAGLAMVWAEASVGVGGTVYLVAPKSETNVVAPSEELKADGTPDAYFRLTLTAPSRKITSLLFTNVGAWAPR